MNYKLMLRMLGRTLQVEALCLIIPMLVALYYQEDPLPFLYTILPVGILGTLLARLRSNAEFFSQEGNSPPLPTASLRAPPALPPPAAPFCRTLSPCPGASCFGGPFPPGSAVWGC